MIACVRTASLFGVEADPVIVEVHVSPGLPGFTLVGQPDGVCREARDRARAAIQSSGYKWPQDKVTVNLAPSSVRKIGAGLDLAIAVGVLVASNQLSAEAVEGVALLGELGLDGTVRPVEGMVPLADAVAGGVLVVPAIQVGEATLLGRHQVRGVPTLRSVVEALACEAQWPDVPPTAAGEPPGPPPDLADVRGQQLARYALEIAAAGGHHLLLSGSPGAGKTMLAERLPGLLPPLSAQQAVEVTRIHSAAGMLEPGAGLVGLPPYQAPHHTASAIALIGGGSLTLRPGAISCAHRGVLFLDELAEFPAAVLDNLRQPLEEGVIRVHRARACATFPARFLLIAAMNPCPCGDGALPGGCRCGGAERLRYLRRVSGPLLDRFDLRLVVARPEVDSLLGGTRGECSAAVAARVGAARLRAAERGVAANAEIPSSQLDRWAPLAAPAVRDIEKRLRTGRLTARGLHRVRRVALTINDLIGEEGSLGDDVVQMALQLRSDLPSLELAS